MRLVSAAKSCRRTPSGLSSRRPRSRPKSTRCGSIRDTPLLVDGPFGLPTVIDGPCEGERLDTMIEQIRSALERLSSGQVLEEVRGAIREYREAKKRDARAGRSR